MIRLRAWLLGLGLALVLTAVAAAAPDDKAKGKGKAKGVPAALDQLVQLLPPDPDNKLKLTADEKKKVDALQTEFSDKSKDALAAAKDEFLKNRDAIQKARKDKDKAALKQALAPVREKVRDFVKMRADYEAQVRDVLTDDQKTTFDQLKADNAPKGPLAQLIGKGKKKKNPNGQ